MTIEALLERIAIALERGNELRKATAGCESTKVTSTHRKEAEVSGQEPETKPEAKPEKEKPKYDFNKDIRGPYVDLLQNVAKSKLGPKETTKLAKKLLQDFTGQVEEVLSIKTLPEEKYEDFLAAVKGYRTQILDDTYQPIED